VLLENIENASTPLIPLPTPSPTPAPAAEPPLPLPTLPAPPETSSPGGLAGLLGSLLGGGR
jgi:phospholipid/cholesterol/gamma-HCH transport system substrate-binding protein